MPTRRADVQLPPDSQVGVVGEGDQIYLVFRLPFTIALTDVLEHPPQHVSPALWSQVLEWVWRDRPPEGELG